MPFCHFLGVALLLLSGAGTFARRVSTLSTVLKISKMEQYPSVKPKEDYFSSCFIGSFWSTFLVGSGDAAAAMVKTIDAARVNRPFFITLVLVG